jgi:hypothetical protein
MPGNGELRCLPLSVLAAPWWAEATGRRRMLWVLLCLHADEHGVCVASLSEMADWQATMRLDLLGRQYAEAPARQTVKDDLTWLEGRAAIRRSVQAKQRIEVVGYVPMPRSDGDAPYSGAVPFQEIVDAYNAAAGGSLRKCRGLSTEREGHLRARWQEGLFRENYARIFEKAAASSLAKDWRGMDFDWLTANGQNYLKVWEGKYDEPPQRRTTAADPRVARQAGGPAAGGATNRDGRSFGESSRPVSAFDGDGDGERTT